MSTKLIAIFLTIFAVGIVVIPVFADNEASKGGLGVFWNDIRNGKQHIRNEIRQNNQNNKEENKGLFQQLKNLRLMFGRLFNATVTGISGTSLTVSDNGKTYTILTDSSTIFRRHFWGKSSISDISVNDHVNVWGKYTDDTKTTIQAHMIRDLSILKRFGVFFGKVTAVNGLTLTLDTVRWGTESATFDSNTKCVQRNEQTMDCSDIKTGERIRVKGTWDEVNKTITGITEIKDFSVPVISPTPTVTPAP